MKELRLEEQIYLCKYHDIDTEIATSMGLRQQEIDELIDKFKKSGLYEQYRKLSDDEYECAINKDKTKSKAEKVLSKYNFDKQRKEYKYFKEVLEISSKYKYIEDFSLSRVFNKVANKYDVKDYIINNDCQRILKNTYLENKKIFELYDYKSKPTVKDFAIKEFKMKYVTNQEMQESETAKTEKKNEEMQNYIKSENYLEELNKAYIKIPVSILLEWSYQKRLYR